jgi:diguanylate cyclase (GGDEF)-like protein
MTFEVVLKRKDGSSFPAEVNVKYIAIDKPCSVFIFHDITERKEAEERIEQVSAHDLLTGLYNRRLLMERLKEEVKRATRNESMLSCFVIDIDHFKEINDTKGHLVGDSVIKQLADFLRQNMRQTDIIARYGGDEFIALLPDTDKGGLEIVGDKLIKKASDMVYNEAGKDIKRTVSIGAACFDGKSIKEKYITDEILTMLCDAVINDADTALYRAKEEGRNRVVIL